MSSPSGPPGSRLSFAVPLGLDPIQEQLLNLSKLDSLYELNRRDFFDIVAILYSAARNDPDPGALADPEKGFDSFCELVTEYLLAAPSSTLARATDKKGNYVNFFGKVIMEQLNRSGVRLSLQDLYGPDNSTKHSHVWELVKTFVRYVVIHAFDDGLVSLQEADITAAALRIEQLKQGIRKLRPVPEDNL